MLYRRKSTVQGDVAEAVNGQLQERPSEPACLFDSAVLATVAVHCGRLDHERLKGYIGGRTAFPRQRC